MILVMCSLMSYILKSSVCNVLVNPLCHFLHHRTQIGELRIVIAPHSQISSPSPLSINALNCGHKIGVTEKTTDIAGLNSELASGIDNIVVYLVFTLKISARFISRIVVVLAGHTLS